MSETAPSEQTNNYIERTVDVVAAYVSNNSVPITELPALIASIHEALNTVGQGAVPVAAEAVEKPTPAQIRKSIRPDGLVSFIDGKSYKTLKRHLTKHGLDPHSYRDRYGLPADYPTTSANYSAQRSALAKSLGLGQPGRSVPAEAAQDSRRGSRARPPRPEIRGRRRQGQPVPQGRRGLEPRARIRTRLAPARPDPPDGDFDPRCCRAMVRPDGPGSASRAPPGEAQSRPGPWTATVTRRPTTRATARRGVRAAGRAPAPPGRRGPVRIVRIEQRRGGEGVEIGPFRIAAGARAPRPPPAAGFRSPREVRNGGRGIRARTRSATPASPACAGAARASAAARIAAARYDGGAEGRIVMGASSWAAPIPEPHADAVKISSRPGSRPTSRFGTAPARISDWRW